MEIPTMTGEDQLEITTCIFTYGHETLIFIDRFDIPTTNPSFLLIGKTEIFKYNLPV